MADESRVVTLRDTVGTLLDQSQDELRKQVQEHLVSVELNQRKTLVIQALAKLDEMDGELRKFKPDQVVYDGEGAVKDEGWSKQNLEARNKAQEKREKLAKAIENALGDKADYAGLKKIVSESK